MGKICRKEFLNWEAERGRGFEDCLRVGMWMVHSEFTRSPNPERDFLISAMRYYGKTYVDISSRFDMTPSACRERCVRIADWGYRRIQKNQETGDALADPKRCQQVKPEEQLKMIRICEVLKGDWSD